MLFLLAVLQRKVQDYRECGLLPFESFGAALKGSGPLLTQIIGNVVAFIPVGLLLGCVLGRMKWWTVLLIGGGFSLLIEILQFVFKRGFAEVDDVVHNMAGCAIGYGVYVAAVYSAKILKNYEDLSH